MRLPGALALLCVALIAASCGSGGAAGDSGTGWLAGDGKPVNLALTFDPANGEAKVITPRGGYVSTSGADGTLYRLEIPDREEPAAIVRSPCHPWRGPPRRSG